MFGIWVMVGTPSLQGTRARTAHNKAKKPSAPAVILKLFNRSQRVARAFNSSGESNPAFEIRPSCSGTKYAIVEI